MKYFNSGNDFSLMEYINLNKYEYNSWHFDCDNEKLIK